MHHCHTAHLVLVHLNSLMLKSISYIMTDKEAVMVVIHHLKQVASPVKRAVLAVKIVKWVQSTHQPRVVSIILFIPSCNRNTCLC